MEINLLHNTPLWVCSSAIRTCWDSANNSDTGHCPQCETDAHGYILNGTDTTAECNRCGTFFDVNACGEKDKALIDRVGNKNKHSSTLEHLNYTFEITGISRALLQELARHRHASLSVKSSRYTLKELKSESYFIAEIPYMEYKAITNGKRSGMITGKSNLSNTYYKIRLDDKGICAYYKYCVDVGGRSTSVNIATALALENLRKIILEGVSNDVAKYALPESYKTGLTYTINMRSLQNLLGLRLSPSALWEFRELASELVKNLPSDHVYLIQDILTTYETKENK